MRVFFALYLGASLILVAIDALTPVESVEWMVHIVLMWIVSTRGTRRELRWAAVFSPLCLLMGALLSGPSYLPRWILLTDRAVAIAAIATIAYFSDRWKAAEERERRASRALEESRSEVRTLRGILPICAACKKIRTDTGAWEQIEVYIRNHSEADFSHGICQDCLRRLYPEFAANPADSP